MASRTMLSAMVQVAADSRKRPLRNQFIPAQESALVFHAAVADVRHPNLDLEKVFESSGDTITAVCCNSRPSHRRQCGSIGQLGLRFWQNRNP